MAVNVSLRCPDCNGEFQVASASGLEEKKVACPHCNKEHKISEYLPKLCFCIGNDRYQLRLGSQWVGRKSASNTAEVQIPDDTRYMSKHHAIVSISFTANGFKCTFEEHGTNPTHLQNVPLIDGDIVYLNVGDCLELGGQKMYLANEYK